MFSNRIAVVDGVRMPAASAAQSERMRRRPGHDDGQQVRNQCPQFIYAWIERSATARRHQRDSRRSPIGSESDHDVASVAHPAGRVTQMPAGPKDSVREILACGLSDYSADRAQRGLNSSSRFVAG